MWLLNGLVKDEEIFATVDIPRPAKGTDRLHWGIIVQEYKKL
jgi:hypothetical protein